MASRPVFAVVGLGRAGNFHMTSLSQLQNVVHLKYVVDVDSAVAEAAAVKYQATPATDFDQVLKDPELKAVVISSSTHAHYAQIMKALDAGKAVFTEKPISFDPAELAMTIDKAIQTKIPFFVGFQRRVDENFKAMREAVLSGQIGQVRMIRSSSRDNPEPSMAYLKISGGIFHDMLCHDFDMLHFITGEIPESVYTVAHTYNPSIAALNDTDTVIATLKYASGIIATVDTSRVSAYGYDQRVEVFGEKGLVQAENERINSVTIATDKGFQTAPLKHSFPQRYLKAYKEEMDQFVNMVRTWTPEDPQTLERHVLLERVATAAEFSWKLQRVVRIDEVEDLRSSAH